MFPTALDNLFMNDGDAGAPPPAAPAYEPPVVQTTMEPGAPAGMDPNLLIQQLAAQTMQQSQVLSELTNQVRTLATQPGIADVDTRSPEEKEISALKSQVNSLAQTLQADRMGRIENAVLMDADAVLDQIIGQDSLVASNPALAQYCKQNAIQAVRGIVRKEGERHNLTRTGVEHIYRQIAETQKQIIQAHPGTAAATAEAQKQVNNRAVDAPGSGSPAPGDGTLPLDPDSDEYWAQKKQMGKTIADKWKQVS